MGTTTLLALEALLSEALGDWREFDTSTNVTTAATPIVIATTLANYDEAIDDYFNSQWLYFTEGNNVGLLRQVRDYSTTANQLTLRGPAFAAESSAITLRLHRFNRDNKKRALNRAIEQLYPSLYKPVDDLTLVTGNELPDASFEWWTSSSAHKFLSATNATLAKTTTDALYRGQRGSTSMKVTASAANGYAKLSSDTYPRLLDLMNRTVDFYCWAYPEVADDASIVIYTKQADGTAQTLTSTTANPAGEFTKLEHEDQTLNDDLVEVEIRFKVATNLKYVYFDDAILCGRHLYEYLLPEVFQTGHVSQVRVQTSGYSDEAAYDIHPRLWDRQQFTLVNDGTYRYLRLKDLNVNYRRIRLAGYAPLSTLDADADTIEIDGGKLNLIIAQAAYNLYQMERGSVSAEDRGRYNQEMNYWAGQVRILQPTLQMIRPSHTIYTG